MVDVGGSPLFQTLALGHFDSTGAFLLADSVPPGLSGLAITFQSFAQKSHRGLRVSAPEVLTFP
jgi:hypothetical protein